MNIKADEVTTVEVMRMISDMCKSTVTPDKILIDEPQRFVVALTAAQYSVACHFLFTKYGAPDIKHEPQLVTYKWVANEGTVVMRQNLRADEVYKLEFQLKEKK
jgi:hypothetical protein